MKDLYEVLGVSQHAALEEIKVSYRRLALQYHPDRNPGDRVAENHFKKISEAYRILSDSEKRQIYDLYGQAGLADLDDLGENSAFEDIFSSFGDVFEDFLNYGRNRNRPDQPQPGADLRTQVIVTLEQALRSLETSVEIERQSGCNVCGGCGLDPGTERRTCPTCGGQGQVSQTKGQLKIFNTCPQCKGAGTIVPFPCKTCGGAGMIKEKKILQVRIPPGVDTGTRLRLRGEGEAGRLGGKPGDLYIEVQMAPHPLFTRKNLDLYYRARLSFVEAALGTEILVPTLESLARLIIPPGTQPGDTFRLPSRGIPGLRSKNRGDLVVVADLRTPEHLSPQQQSLLKEFLRLSEAAEQERLEGKGRVGCE